MNAKHINVHHYNNYDVCIKLVALCFGTSTDTSAFIVVFSKGEMKREEGMQLQSIYRVYV